jgi:hypothetical protein
MIIKLINTGLFLNAEEHDRLIFLTGPFIHERFRDSDA